ncbi:MAG: hypothetical protein IJS28_11535 [Synergistaceae bacterium]|nr:hypothetical protein [Synergistaceae bacterium]
MTDYDKINSELHSLDREAQELDAEVDADLHNMKNIADEANRVADVAHNASEILDDLDREFEEKTSLDKLDVAFMFLAAAIQCVRWYFLPNNKGRLTSQEGDKLMGKIVPKKWQDILLGSVPYDAIQGGADVDAGLGGLNHRYRTLGHDPIAGWIFGPVNILSDTLTKTDFTSYNVADMVITGQTATTGAFSRAYEQTRADKMNLPAAIARQALHLGSDVFTELSLPIPFVGMLSDSAAKWLTQNRIDMWSITRSVTLAGLVNTFIAWTHRLFYDPASTPPKSTRLRRERFSDTPT